MDLGTVESMGVLGAEVSSEGDAASGTAECSWKEEWFREGARTFFLGLQWVVSTSSLSLIRDAPDEVQHVSQS